MKKPRFKKHLIDGNYYSVRALTIKLGLNHHRIKAKIFNDGATTMAELREPPLKLTEVSFQRSMFFDKNGHWKLLAKALGC